MSDDYPTVLQLSYSDKTTFLAMSALYEDICDELVESESALSARDISETRFRFVERTLRGLEETGYIEETGDGVGLGHRKYDVSDYDEDDHEDVLDQLNDGRGYL